MQKTTLTIIALSALVALPALAQSDIDAALEAAAAAESAAAGEEAPPPEPSEAEPVVPVEAAPATTAATADESIYIVQDRAYSKSGKFEVTPLFFTSLNNKFVGHFGLGVSLAYHMRENLALEIQSTIPYVMAQFYSALVFEVYDYESLTPEVVDLKQMDYFGAISVLFSGLYGKMEFYGYLIDYDFFATAGVGVVSTLETCAFDRGDCSGDVGIGQGLHSPEDAGDRFKLSGNLGGGMRFFFSDYVGLRLEIRDIVYSDRAVGTDGVTTTDIRNNVLFMAGLTFLL